MAHCLVVDDTLAWVMIAFVVVSSALRHWRDMKKIRLDVGPWVEYDYWEEGY